MKTTDFAEGFPGELVRISSSASTPSIAFLPNPLPPDITFDMSLMAQAERSAIAIGKLNGLGVMLPNPYLLIQPFVRREALASSRIEGTQADFRQMVLLEATPHEAQSDADVQEVINYGLALQAGWSQPSEREMSTGLILELHKLLMSGVRAQDKKPGELRDRQVLIGSPGQQIHEARFVPPPPLEVRSLLDDLFAYARSPSSHPALIRIAYIHYQFEAIHPFLDGNGRLGRLLIPLLLRQWSLLDHPLLYLSEYFERNRDEYVDGLYNVSVRGNWHQWTQFVLLGIEQQAHEAFTRGRALISMREELRQRYVNSRSPKVLTIIDHLFDRPTISFNEAAQITGMTHRAARSLVRILEEDGVVEEVTGQNRNMIFMAMDILRAVTASGEPDTSR